MARYASCQLALVVAMTIASATTTTDQIRDAIKFENQRQWIQECPLNDLLRNAKPCPKFDVQETCNWKAYDAAWEIKDDKLFLVSFEAKRNGRRVMVEDILPGKKFPILADWYTGEIQITFGHPIGGFGRYDAKYARLVVLDIAKGKVVKKTERKDAWVKSLDELQREEEKKAKNETANKTAQDKKTKPRD